MHLSRRWTLGDCYSHSYLTLKRALSRWGDPKVCRCTTESSVALNWSSGLVNRKICSRTAAYSQLQAFSILGVAWLTCHARHVNKSPEVYERVCEAFMEMVLRPLLVTRSSYSSPTQKRKMPSSRAVVSLVWYPHTRYSFQVKFISEIRKKEERKKMNKIEIFSIGFLERDKS